MLPIYSCPSKHTEAAASSALVVHAMAAAVVDVEVEAAASVAVVAKVPSTTPCFTGR
jgi:hypothetical protein